MKIFTLFLAFAALCCHVAANPESIGYEIVHAYYAYKIEYTSRIAPRDRKLGIQCTRNKRGQMCGFGDFAESLFKGSNIRRKIRQNYRANKGTLPGYNDATFLSRTVKRNDFIVASSLSKSFNEGQRYPYARIVEDLTSAIVTASEAGRASKADFDKAAIFADEARAVRAKASFSSVAQVVMDRMGSDQGYFVKDSTSKSYDWADTLKNIDDAVSEGKMSQARAQELRKLLTDAKNFDLPGLDHNNKNHWATTRAYAFFATKARDISGRMAAGAASVPATGGGACGSQFVTD